MGNQDTLDNEMRGWHQHTEDLVQSYSDTWDPRCGVKAVSLHAPHRALSASTVTSVCLQRTTSAPMTPPWDKGTRFRSTSHCFFLLVLGRLLSPSWAPVALSEMRCWAGRSSSVRRNTNCLGWRQGMSTVPGNRTIWKRSVPGSTAGNLTLTA